VTQYIAIIRNRLDMADLFSPFSRHNNASVFPFALRLLQRTWTVAICHRPSVCLSVWL